MENTVNVGMILSIRVITYSLNIDSKFDYSKNKKYVCFNSHYGGLFHKSRETRPYFDQFTFFNSVSFELPPGRRHDRSEAPYNTAHC